jgi:subtilisin family serine protease
MKSSIIIIITLLSLSLFGGEWWIFFADKGELPAQSIEAYAEQFVSERGLARRAKHGIESGIRDIPVNNDYIMQIEDIGGRHISSSKWLNASVFEIENIDAVSNLPFVVKIQPVGRIVKSPQPIGIEKLYRPSDDPDSIYGVALNQLSQLGVPHMHEAGYTGQGITIGVFDTGARLTHPAFRAMNVIATYDFINDTTYVDNLPGERVNQFEHGTNTLNCVGGYLPGVYVGPAYDASFIIAKTESRSFELITEEYNWVEAMEWAEGLGVDVISTSLGYIEYDDGEGYTFDDMDGNTAVITQAADLAVNEYGILVSVSAGNERETDFPHIDAPADGDSVLTVGAQRSDGLYATFSSPGPTADGRIKPDVTALGDGVSIPSPADETGLATTSVSGTSYSCPLTAGTVALVWQKLGNEYNGYDIIEILRASADQYTFPDNDYGWGRPYAPIAAGLSDGIHISLVDSQWVSDDSVSVVPIVSDRVYIGHIDNSWEFEHQTDNRGILTVYPYERGVVRIEAVSTDGHYARTVQIDTDTLTTNIIRIDMTPDIDIPTISDSKFNVYPNPADAYFYITIANTAKTATASSITVLMFDASGSPVYEENLPMQKFDSGLRTRINTKELDLNLLPIRDGDDHFAPGIYILQLYLEDESGDVIVEETKKIILRMKTVAPTGIGQ